MKVKRSGRRVGSWLVTCFSSTHTQSCRLGSYSDSYIHTLLSHTHTRTQLHSSHWILGSPVQSRHSSSLLSSLGEFKVKRPQFVFLPAWYRTAQRSSFPPAAELLLRSLLAVVSLFPWQRLLPLLLLLHAVLNRHRHRLLCFLFDFFLLFFLFFCASPSCSSRALSPFAWAQSLVAVGRGVHNYIRLEQPHANAPQQ